MSRDFIVDTLSKVLTNIEIQLKDINEYEETNYFTILGEVRAIEHIIEFLNIEDDSIEIKFNRLWKLNKENQGV